MAGLLIGWQLMRWAYGDRNNSISAKSLLCYFLTQRSIVLLERPGSMAMHATTSEIRRVL
jgi:hypothetical protein